MPVSYFDFIYATIRNYEFVDVLVSRYVDFHEALFPMTGGAIQL
jgi:hypothetical protein